MKVYGRVQSTVKPNDIEIDEYSVWENKDISEISVEHEGESLTLFEYRQIQYGKDEYIRLISEQNKDLADKVTDTQLALCEVYELIGG